MKCFYRDRISHSCFLLTTKLLLTCDLAATSDSSATYFRVTCDLFATHTYMRRICDLLATWLQLTCGVNATYLRLTCDLAATYLRGQCNLFATSLPNNMRLMGDLLATKLPGYPAKPPESTGILYIPAVSVFFSNALVVYQYHVHFYTRNNTIYGAIIPKVKVIFSSRIHASFLLQTSKLEALQST